MPHLLNFIKNNGVLLSNHHTPLISHTSDDVITILTGVSILIATGWQRPPKLSGIPGANAPRDRSPPSLLE